MRTFEHLWSRLHYKLCGIKCAETEADLLREQALPAVQRQVGCHTMRSYFFNLSFLFIYISPKMSSFHRGARTLLQWTPTENRYQRVFFVEEIDGVGCNISALVAVRTSLRCSLDILNPLHNGFHYSTICPIYIVMRRATLICINSVQGCKPKSGSRFTSDIMFC